VVVEAGERMNGLGGAKRRTGDRTWVGSRAPVRGICHGTNDGESRGTGGTGERWRRLGMMQWNPHTWGPARRQRASWQWGVPTLAGQVNGQWSGFAGLAREEKIEFKFRFLFYSFPKSIEKEVNQ
jgi:hypothetical protein